MSREATWTNSDGLVVGFGTHSADNNVPAVYCGANGEVTITVEYDLVADLPDTFAAANRKPQEIVIPRGSIFKSGYVQTIEAATSGTTSYFILGTWGTSDVVDDADGLVAGTAMSDATLANVGDVNIMAGGLIADAADSGLAVAGATSNSDVVLAPSYDTVFTGGKVRCVITYIPPNTIDPLTV